MEQYSRRDCIEISGLPQENDEDLKKLVVKIGSLMDVELDERHISISHRLPKSRSENQQENREVQLTPLLKSLSNSYVETPKLSFIKVVYH